MSCHLSWHQGQGLKCLRSVSHRAILLQGVVQGPAHTPFWNLLEMHTLHHPWPTGSESLGVGPRHLSEQTPGDPHVYSSFRGTVVKIASSTFLMLYILFQVPQQAILVKSSWKENLGVYASSRTWLLPSGEFGRLHRGLLDFYIFMSPDGGRCFAERCW